MPRTPKFFGSMSYSKSPIAGFSIYQQKPKETIENLVAELEREDIEAERRKVLLNKLKARVRESEELHKDTTTVQEKPLVKRFNVVDGKIIPDDENGQYNLGSAISVAMAENKKAGVTDYSGIAAIIGAVDKLKPGESLNIRDMTESVKDLALALQPQSSGISPTELEMRLENTQLKTRQEIQSMLQELKDSMRREPKDQDSPFTIDEHGNPAINRGAKLTAQDLMAWEMINRPKSSPFGIKSEGGNLVPIDIDTWLKVDTHRNKERREDEKVSILQEGIKLAREIAPDAMVAVRNLGGPSGKTRDALKKGGWAKEEKPALNRTKCGSCETTIEFAPGTKLLECPKCHESNFLGSPEELKQEMTKWSSVFQEKESTKQQPPSEESSSKPKSDAPSPES